MSEPETIFYPAPRNIGFLSKRRETPLAGVSADASRAMVGITKYLSLAKHQDVERHKHPGWGQTLVGQA